MALDVKSKKKTKNEMLQQSNQKESQQVLGFYLS